jgi:DNA-directed RNA polymerase subunit RPC12/RpoP
MCAGCGATAESPQATWTFSVENGERRYFCDVCSRKNLRAIEGRLDSSWW